MKRNTHIVRRGFAMLMAAVLMFGETGISVIATENKDPGNPIVSDELHCYNDSSATSGFFGDYDEFSWAVDVATKTLTVTGEGSLCGEGMVGGYYFYSPFLSICNNHDIKKIVLNCTLSGRVEGLFSELEDITEIDLSGSDMSRVSFSMTSMFSGCKNLKHIDLSGINTSDVFYMDYLFSGCESLKSINLSGWDTSHVERMLGMFGGCTNLEEINLSSFDTSEVEIMSHMFSRCVSLKSLDLSNFDTSNVENMYAMFYRCENLSVLNVDSFDTSKVTDMGNMFSRCYSLTSIDLSNFDTSNVENFGNLFYRCVNLCSVDISGFDTRSWRTNAFGVFGSCYNLSIIKTPKAIGTYSINLPYSFYDDNKKISDISGDETNKTITSAPSSAMYTIYFDKNGADIGTEFSQAYTIDESSRLPICSYYRTGNIFTGWNTRTDGTGAQYSDRETIINLTNNAGANITLYAQWGSAGTMGSHNGIQYNYNKATKTLTVTGEDTLTDTYCGKDYDEEDDDGDDELDEDECGMYLTPYNEYIEWGIPLLYWSPFETICTYSDIENISFVNCKITNAPSYLFAGLTTVKSIDLSGLDTSNMTSMQNMFLRCFNLENLNLNNISTENVTNMEGMFSGCNKLQSINLRHFNTAKVTDMTDMFNDCYEIESLDLSSFITSSVTYMSNMFSSCHKLSSLDVSSFDTTKVTDMRGMFFACTSLTSLNLKNFNTPNLIRVGGDEENRGMFSSCTSLKSLDISGLDTSKIYSMSELFSNCSSLTELNLSNFNTSNVCTMEGMFRDCTSLKRVNISNFDTSKVESVTEMFSGCTSLEEIDLSGFNTGKIEYMRAMFYDCQNLTHLDLSQFDTTNTVSIEEMFSGCVKLTSLDLSSFDTTEIEELNDVFTNCSSLMNLNTPKSMGTDNIDLPHAFYDASDNDYFSLSAANTGMLLTAMQRSAAYRVTYLSNTSDAIPQNMMDQYIKPGENAYLTANKYKKEGFMFKCWNTKPDGTGITYSDMARINAGDAGNALNLYAQWKNQEYSITYILNGGTNNNLNPKVYDVATETITLLVPTRTGYTFDGWYSEDSFTNKITGITKGSTGDKRLYAKWTAIIGDDTNEEKYAITYNLDGGTNASANPANYTSTTETITLSAPTKTGFTFDGWYSDEAFTTKVTEIAKGSTGDKTLYAKWAINKYSITFDGNGSTEGAMENASDISYGTEQALPENTFKRTAYAFSGWNTKADGTGTAYADKAEVQNLSAENGATIKLYAQWTIVKYSITYNLDGGTNATSNPKSYDAESETITLAEPSKSGYIFDGWYADAAFTTEAKEIAKGSTGDKTFYAKWKKPGKYSISYQLFGGTNAASNPDRYDETTTPITLSAPTREGYDFDGWYSDSSFKNKVTELKTTDKGNLILRAKWTAHKYSITFNKGGDGVAGKMTTLKNRVYDTAYELSANKFKRNGFIFLGWGLEENGTDVAFRDRENIKNLTSEKGGSVPLYAKWLELAENKAYSITYRLNGGTNDPENPAYYIEGTSVTFKDPIKAGYKFDGWYTNSNLKKGRTEKIDNDGKGNKTLYAKWTPLTYTIKFNGNPKGITAGNSDATSGTNGKVEKTMTETTNVRIGKKVTLKPNKFTYEGYTFAGWNTAPDGSGTFYKNKANAKDIALLADGTFSDTITLYAQWTETKYTITYTLNKGKLPKAADLPEGTSCPKSYTISSDTITLAEPTRKNYTFAGWYTTKKFKDGTKVETIPTGNTGKLTLYAKWVKNK